MASIGHVALGIAANRHVGLKPCPKWKYFLVGFALVLISYLPDLDVVGLYLQIPYEAPWGHRGASHSLAFACLLGPFFGVLLKRLGVPLRRGALVSTLLLMSHGMLDAMTSGGLGVAFFWPLSNERYFFAWRPIPVSMIGLRFWHPYQLKVFLIEMLLFAPFLIYGLWRRQKR